MLRIVFARASKCGTCMRTSAALVVKSAAQRSSPAFAGGAEGVALTSQEIGRSDSEGGAGSRAIRRAAPMCLDAPPLRCGETATDMVRDQGPDHVWTALSLAATACIQAMSAVGPADMEALIGRARAALDEASTFRAAC